MKKSVRNHFLHQKLKFKLNHTFSSFHDVAIWILLTSGLCWCWKCHSLIDAASTYSLDWKYTKFFWSTTSFEKAKQNVFPCPIAQINLVSGVFHFRGVPLLDFLHYSLLGIRYKPCQFLFVGEKLFWHCTWSKMLPNVQKRWKWNEVE